MTRGGTNKCEKAHVDRVDHRKDFLRGMGYSSNDMKELGERWGWGLDVDDLRKGTFEELEANVNAISRFRWPRLDKN